MSPARILLEGRAFFALLVIIAVFSLMSPNYFSGANFLTMASHVAIFGLPAIGMLLVILNGGIDLSVGSTLGLAGVCAGYMMQGINLEALGVVLYLPVWAVAILTLAVGALVGLVNGVLIAVPGSCLCGHAWLAVCRARYRAADDQRPDLQQAFRQRRRWAIPVLTGWASTAFSMSRSGC